MRLTKSKVLFTLNKTVKPPSLRKLHSLHALLRERVFVGNIEAGNATHQFTFAPSAVAVVNGKLELTGRFTVQSAGGRARGVDGVKAVLAATQGNLGTAPPRPRALANLTIPAPPEMNDGLPLTEAAGPRASVGVLYFKLSALDGRALGVPLDLSAVQLNGRLAPIDQTARDLQWLFSAVVMELAGGRAAEALNATYLANLNLLLKA